MTKPTMNRTGWAELVVPAVVVGVIVYVLLRAEYAQLPPLGYFTPVPIAVLAVAELVAAGRVRGAVRHEPHARPMTAIAIARCVALGKASAMVGAAVIGAGAALLVRVLPDARDVRAAANDGRVGALVVGAAILLVIGGLLLERAGIDPNKDRRDRFDEDH